MILRNITPWLLSLVLTFVLLEGLVRIWGYSNRCIYDPIYTLYNNCDTPLVVHKPNLHKALARAMTYIDTDSLGLRSMQPGEVLTDKAPDEIRIAITGDSFTFGHGVADTAETYPAALESILNSKSGGKNKFRVFNFGVSAYSLAEMTATLKCRMFTVQPDIVICGFIFDDFNPNRMVGLDQYGYTIDRSLGQTSDRFQLIKRLLRGLHLSHLIKDALIRLSREGSPLDSAKAYVDEMYRHLREFRKIALQHGNEYCFVLLPSFGSSDLAAIVPKLEADNLQFVDLSDLWKQFSLEEFRVSKFDNHPSAAVHKEIAAKLAAYIEGTLKPKITRWK